MRKIKYIIPIVLLFIVIGYAIVATVLNFEGTTSIAANDEDFKVYFSKVLVNDTVNEKIVENSTTLNFENELKLPGDTYKIDYEVTNGSKNFDANITMNCTEGNEYISVVNTFNTVEPLNARKTRNGTLVIKKLKANSNDMFSHNITCTINATAIERDKMDNTDVPSSLLPYPYKIGKEVKIDTETFNIISETDTTVTLLAQYNLGANYRQTEEAHELSFSEVGGWENTPGPKDIDIYTWSTNPKKYVTEYVSYLQTYTKDPGITGDLISVRELGELDCTVSSDYSIQNGLTCENSKYSNWIINNQWWFTKSAGTDYSRMVWVVTPVGALNDDLCVDIDGIRPTITIKKDTLNKYL